MPTKTIVTNRSALKAKYGTRGYDRVRRALARLVKADARRRIETTVVALDDPREMKAFDAPAVGDAADARAVKRAIDAVYREGGQPDYLVILGAPDVVPHVPLVNPIGADGDDDDRVVPSDLPYACEAPYSTRVQSFLQPTRVVGRVPDLVAARSPKHLLALLKTAATWESGSRAAYARVFGLSTKTWRKSTSMSLRSLAGTDEGMHVSPPSVGSKWTAAQLAPRLHFVNCHGGDADPCFYGEPQNFPVAVDAAKIAGKIVPGTVAAMECCYGGQLYDPALAVGSGICHAYLEAGAYGYLGSTTIAYGPADTNGAADLVCRWFLARVREGASTGRAALEARQRYMQEDPLLDPVDLKTLAQFLLLGDPSIHPVLSEASPRRSALRAKSRLPDPPLGVAERRHMLAERGKALGRSVAFSSEPAAETRSAVLAKLQKLAQSEGLGAAAFRSFPIEGGQATLETVTRSADRRLRTAKVKTKTSAAAGVRFHVAFTPEPAARGRKAGPAGGPKRGPARGPKAQRVLVVQESRGELIDYKVYTRR